MRRGKIGGLIIGAVALVAVVGSGEAAETIIKATSAINGEGRFYKATDQLLLFSGYFQGNIGGGRSGSATSMRPGWCVRVS